MIKIRDVGILFSAFGLMLQAHAEEASFAPVENSAVITSNDISSLLAVADAAAGKKVANKCISCHTFDKGSPNKVGPNLYGILGKRMARVDGFLYSSAMKSRSEDTWDYKNIFSWLNSPKKFIPGNRMAFGGVSSNKDIADLVAFLRSQHDNPPSVP